jgi:cytochrome oxidase Cu insertion factor (SCO1/SenC/PrrC family)
MMESEVQSVNRKQRNRSRMTIVGMFILFLVPVVAAIVLHSVDNGIGTSYTTNRGVLIRPVQPLPMFSLDTVDGKTLTLDELKGFWSLVYIDSASCNQQCEKNLYKIRQSRLATGGEKERVRRLMILIDGQPSTKLQALLKEHPGMDVSSVDQQALNILIKPFNKDGKAATAQRIYIVDPFGNLMMQYAAEVEPKDVVKDLERLLKYSQTG